MPSEPPFALYPIVSDKSPGAKSFFYHSPTHSTPFSGAFRDAPVLTIRQVSAVAHETREMGSTSFIGLALNLTDAGKETLREHLKASSSASLAVAIDGRIYGSLDAKDIRYVAESRGNLFIMFPNPGESTTQHLVRLLAEKLSSEVEEQRTGK